MITINPDDYDFCICKNGVFVGFVHLGDRIYERTLMNLKAGFCEKKTFDKGSFTQKALEKIAIRYRNQILKRWETMGYEADMGEEFVELPKSKKKPDFLDYEELGGDDDEELWR